MQYTDILSLVISFLAVAVAVITNIRMQKITKDTKRFELTSDWRNELIAWHTQTVEQLTLIREFLINDISHDKSHSLAKLYALAEQGRFYFHNVEGLDDDTFDIDELSAYKGYREATIELLVRSYTIAKRNDAKEHINKLYLLQRLFTSRIFDILSPYNTLSERFNMLNVEEYRTSCKEYFDKNSELYDLLDLSKNWEDNRGLFPTYRSNENENNDDENKSDENK